MGLLSASNPFSVTAGLLGLTDLHREQAGFRGQRLMGTSAGRGLTSLGALSAGNPAATGAGLMGITDLVTDRA